MCVHKPDFLPWEDFEVIIENKFNLLEMLLSLENYKI